MTDVSIAGKQINVAQRIETHGQQLTTELTTANGEFQLTNCILCFVCELLYPSRCENVN